MRIVWGLDLGTPGYANTMNQLFLPRVDRIMREYVENRGRRSKGWLRLSELGTTVYELSLGCMDWGL